MSIESSVKTTVSTPSLNTNSAKKQFWMIYTPEEEMEMKVAALTSVRDLATKPLSNEVVGYYNLSAMRLAQPGRGITIVKFKDGRSIKVQK
jgi:hypothetical protein